MGVGAVSGGARQAQFSGDRGLANQRAAPARSDDRMLAADAAGQAGRRFRAVRPAAGCHDAGQALPGDPRIIRVGRRLRRTSLDDLPQLVKVLRGEVSLVGLRPDALREDLLFAWLMPRYAAPRRVRPGFTGPAQLDGAAWRCALPRTSTGVAATTLPACAAPVRSG